jgi:hypothetical protein
MSVEIVVRSNRLPQLPAHLCRGVEEIDTKAAFDIYWTSVPLTPVQTTALRTNVRITPARGRKPASVHWRQFYAAYQELGTGRGVAPKRFATQAVQRVQPGWIRAHEALLRRL